MRPSTALWHCVIGLRAIAPEAEGNFLLESLLSAFRSNPEITETQRALRHGTHRQLLSGIGASQKTTIMASLWEGSNGGRPWLLVTHNAYQAGRIYEDLVTLLGPQDIELFPAMDTLPHEETSELENQGARARVLARLVMGEQLIVVTHFSALCRKMMPPGLLHKDTLRLSSRMEIAPAELVNHAVNLGYERVDRVEGPGQFARRGGIFDIWPPTTAEPYRVEFFGDEIESIRTFEPIGQRSTSEDKELLIWPTRDSAGDIDGYAISELVREKAAAQASALRKSGLAEAGDRLEQTMNEMAERLEQLGHFPGRDQFMPFFYGARSVAGAEAGSGSGSGSGSGRGAGLVTLLDYMPEALVFLDEPVRIQEYGQAAEREIAEAIMANIERGFALKDELEIFAGYDEIMNVIEYHDTISMVMLPTQSKGQRPERTVTFPIRTARSFQGKSDRLKEELRRWQQDRVAVLLLVNDSEQARHLGDMLREDGINAVYDPQCRTPLEGGITVVSCGKLESGFECTQPRLVVLTVHEIFGRQEKKKRARFANEGIKISAYTDLRSGDYVVHVNHGIGQYLGMKTLLVAGVHRDYLHVQYAGGDVLYVPVDQVNMLQKYVGSADDAPRLHKLGGTDWQKTKLRVKESVKEMADGLLKLYATRETMPGFAFAPDTPWQAQFEDAFIYEETPDQLKAIAEIKRDMEDSKAMDRLLCGDVGYGKTEVAIRAAFKAVDNGKQVAVLVPTTILAQQHYQTFLDRFADFPAISIRSLSRFQSPKEQKETLKLLAEGRVDIIIGTHRLFSSDIIFKNLGLLIVDEEQRFGVAHKERLKELRKNVDVLTLTATPIPRTLHMALVGVRDMSVIETPPEDRFPVRTYVTEYNDGLIQEAIQRELAREGQIYFVYNRIESIDQMANHLQELVPDARILVGHGQMSEDTLERVMLDFIDGEADILLCTTIIESGMDIPNVNTLIVYDADRLGLAQLYQLRGRVGRSNRIAYAYFTYRKDKVINEVAEKRLQAIRDFTELGSGFKIAMRDLEIRGAGNLLGPEQHGHIASVGFEMYCRLLEEAVQELRGNYQPEPPDTVVELPVDAYLPDTYIPDVRQKVEMYKKIAAVKNVAEAEQLAGELKDRFGNLPEEVANLVALSVFRARFRAVGVQSISTERDALVIRFHEGVTPDSVYVHRLLRQKRPHVTYHTGKGVQLRVHGAVTMAQAMGAGGAGGAAGASRIGGGGTRFGSAVGAAGAGSAGSAAGAGGVTAGAGICASVSQSAAGMVKMLQFLADALGA